MTVLKAGSPNYWWLYEGTPGGLLQTGGANADRLTRSNGDQHHRRRHVDDRYPRR